MRHIEFKVPAEDAGVRLDKVIAARGGISRGEARRLLDAGAVFVEGRRTKVASRAVSAGQTVRAVLEEGGRSPAPAPEPVLGRERILHLDPDLVAVDKPPGVMAQAGLTGDRESLPKLVALTLGGPEPGLVHRLDRETSGITVLGRRAKATSALAAAFREGQVHKVYLAVTCGAPTGDQGRLEAELARDPANPARFRCVESGGIPAATRWWVLERFGESIRPGGFALIRLEPETGRTHQLRVHLAALGAPILGDRRYGGQVAVTLPDGTRIEAPRVLLHAWRLALPHPRTAELLRLEAPHPADLRAVVERLGGRFQFEEISE